jgi:hypothetical protein
MGNPNSPHHDGDDKDNMGNQPGHKDGSDKQDAGAHKQNDGMNKDKKDDGMDTQK